MFLQTNHAVGQERLRRFGGYVHEKRQTFFPRNLAFFVFQTHRLLWLFTVPAWTAGLDERILSSRRHGSPNVHQLLYRRPHRDPKADLAVALCLHLHGRDDLETHLGLLVFVASIGPNSELSRYPINKVFRWGLAWLGQLSFDTFQIIKQPPVGRGICLRAIRVGGKGLFIFYPYDFVSILISIRTVWQ